MATLTVDLSGAAGLSTKFNGDLHSTSSQPHLRYLAGDGQMVSGIFNPFKRYGYMSPSNKSKTDISGTITTHIVTSEYDSVNDVTYFGESGVDITGTGIITKLDGNDDTSLTNVTSSVATHSVADFEIYMLNGTRAILHTGVRADDYNSKTVGVIPLDIDSGAAVLEAKVTESRVTKIEEGLNNIGGNTKLAQKIVSSSLSGTSSVRGVRVRIAGNCTNTFNIRVSLQADSAGNPSGTVLTSATYSSDDLTTINTDGSDVFMLFPSAYSISGTMWLVLDVATISDMGSDTIYWYRTDDGNTLYSSGEAKQYSGGSWSNADPSTSESFDFSLYGDRSSVWFTGSDVWGSDDSDLPAQGGSNFLQKSDNGFCYWFTSNRVHKIDGGLSGGRLGSITKDVLVFPSYFEAIDAIDTNGLMYIGVQTSPTDGASTTRSFNGDVCGVYVWDRQTTVVRTRDFIPIPGAREIKKIYQTREGDVRCITINNDRQTEIRVLSNSSFVVVKQLGVGAYPPYRDSLVIMNNHVQWLGYDGLIYAHGKPTPDDKEGLYIIGDATQFASGAFVAGIMMVGNEPASGQEQACYISFTDAGTPKLVKWYPHGTGTLNSVAQVANQGDVYAPVTYLPRLSTVRDITIYCAPGTNTTTDTVATVKIYFNQSSTAGMTKIITKKDISRGYVTMDVNKHYVNAVQFEIEWSTSLTMGTDDFTPSIAIINYDTTTTHSPSAN